MTDTYRVTVLLASQWAGVAEVFNLLTYDSEDTFSDVVKRTCNADKVAYLVIVTLGFDVTGRTKGSFLWTCPDCGVLTHGEIDKEPKSGWDEPRWVISDPYGKPTLNPSLA